MSKLSLKDLEELLNFYIASTEGLQELRASGEHEKVLAHLIERKLLHQTSECSEMYGYTAGYAITKAGRATIETVLDTFEISSSMLVEARPPSDSPPGISICN
jgi:hypothetical protein